MQTQRADKLEIIAEAGLNHGGRLDRAMELVDAAKYTGADVVKFQTYIVERLLRRDDPEWDLLSRLALSWSDFVRLAEHCRGQDIEFMSTPGDAESLAFLVEECGVGRIKIGSDDLANFELLRAAEATKLPVIVSTGMGTMVDVRKVMEVFDWDRERLTLLHCTSLYPTRSDQVNMRAMDMLANAGTRVGYSDHTTGITACVLAVARGAQVVEKHIMLQHDFSCVDAPVSVDPRDFRMMVASARLVVDMLGSHEKEPCPEEREQINKLRKGADGLRGIAA